MKSGEEARFLSQARRHRLPDCWSPISQGQGSSARHHFLLRLDDIPVDETAMFELQRHGFLRTRKWIPQEQFHNHFNLGAQVNRYESTVAYVYTQGTAFAYAANRLCRERRWDELIEQYGRCVRCLWAYCEKMQARYGEEQVLYRGMNGQWAEFKDRYVVGEQFEWQAFTSTSTSMTAALDFAKGVNAKASDQNEMPILFCIKTLSRGAPLLRWSKCPDEDEILLLPFQSFSVERAEVREGTLFIELQTRAPRRTLSAYEVSCEPGLGYRYSRNLNDRDHLAEAPTFGSVVQGAQEGANWIVTQVPGTGERFMPILIDGLPKLRIGGSQILHQEARLQQSGENGRLCSLCASSTCVPPLANF